MQTLPSLAVRRLISLQVSKGWHCPLCRDRSSFQIRTLGLDCCTSSNTSLYRNSKSLHVESIIIENITEFEMLHRR